MTYRFWRLGAAPIAMLSGIALTPAAQANNYGESLAWQFRTSADRVRRSHQKRRSGYYQAPVYNTTIDYNCGITSSASGNSGTQTALANSPSVTGAISAANGNVSNTDVSTRSGASAGTDQTNSGSVSAATTGFGPEREWEAGDGLSGCPLRR